jgi:hypothetical protein
MPDKMKTIIMLISLMILSVSISMAFTSDAIADHELKYENPAFDEKAEPGLSAEESHALELRVKEIRDMDKSELTSEERQELRKELMDIREQANQPGGRIYIGVGTLLLIVILILLLR